MIYHLDRDGTSLGTLPEEELIDAIYDGRLQLNDLAWCEGMEEWMPLDELVDIEVIPEPPPLPTTARQGTRKLPPRQDFGRPPPNYSKGGVSLPPGSFGALPMPPLPGATQAMPRPIAVDTSGAATASLVCGILGLFVGCLTGVPAMILGIVGMRNIERSGGLLGGKGQAIAGLVLGGITTFFITAMLGALVVPAYTSVQERARMMGSVTNARTIVVALHNYAADHNGVFPDRDEKDPPQSANEAFRILMSEGLINNELIFTAFSSPYVGDEVVGEAPHFNFALGAGENHWAMTKGLDEQSSGRHPLVFENPMPGQTGQAWPPSWNMSEAGRPVPGRAWRSAKVIVGRVDGSVNPEQLATDTGRFIPLLPGVNGKDIFTAFDEKGTYLDVQR